MISFGSLLEESSAFGGPVLACAKNWLEPKEKFDLCKSLSTKEEHPIDLIIRKIVSCQYLIGMKIVKPSSH